MNILSPSFTSEGSKVSWKKKGSHNSLMVSVDKELGWLQIAVTIKVTRHILSSHHGSAGL